MLYFFYIALKQKTICNHTQYVWPYAQENPQIFSFMNIYSFMLCVCDSWTLSAVYCIIILLQNDQKYQLSAAPDQER